MEHKDHIVTVTKESTEGEPLEKRVVTKAMQLERFLNPSI